MLQSASMDLAPNKVCTLTASHDPWAAWMCVDAVNWPLWARVAQMRDPIGARDEHVLGKRKNRPKGLGWIFGLYSGVI